MLGFRSGVAERLGIDFETLSSINPRLVYVHAAGYGVTGPYAHRPVYATTAMALAGSVARHAGSWMDPKHVRGIQRARTAGGHRAASPRSRRRRLERVARCVLRAPLRAHTPATHRAGPVHLDLDDRRKPLRLHRRRRHLRGQAAIAGSRHRALRARCAVSPLSDPATTGSSWRQPTRRSGWRCSTPSAAPRLVDDPRFATAASRRAHNDALASVLSEVFARRTRRRVGAPAHRGRRRLLRRRTRQTSQWGATRLSSPRIRSCSRRA